MKTLLTLATVALSVLACSEDDDCGPIGESCVGPGAKRTCFGAPVSGIDDHEVCAEGARCVENVRSNGQPYAACAIGGESDPGCDRDSDATYCHGNTWVICHGRYREREIACGAHACVEEDGGARCAE